MRNKERGISIRREVTTLIGVLFYAAVLMGGYMVLLDQTNKAAEWERAYHTAKETEAKAVALLGEQVREFEDYKAMIELDRKMEEAQQAQAIANYEALGIYQYIGECVITHYCCESRDDPHICGTGTGLTATGIPVAPGMVAVDPDIIPLGSTVIIGGVSYLAADTGVSGYHIDIAVQTHEEAAGLGVTSAQVWIVTGGDTNDYHAG